MKTAKILLGGGDDATKYSGFNELYFLEKTGEVPNALGKSMEAIIYDNPKYHSLFSKEEIDTCKKLLENVGYFDK